MTSARVQRIARAICRVRRGDECERHAFGGDDRDCGKCDFAVLSENQARAAIAEYDAECVAATEKFLVAHKAIYG